MRSAIKVPIAPPISTPAAISSNEITPGSASVVAIAITMPATPITLPRRAVSGEDSPRSAMMKQIAAAR